MRSSFEDYGNNGLGLIELSINTTNTFYTTEIRPIALQVATKPHKEHNLAATNSSRSPLLALPPGLRQQIHEELLNTICPTTLFYNQNPRDFSLDLSPATLRVSRQIYTESVWILYEPNAFLISVETEFRQGVGG